MKSTAQDAQRHAGRAVAAAGEERSYWQPMPANGFVIVKLRAQETGSDAASMGIQCVAPGSYVREHSHVDQEEIIFVFEGLGTAVVNGTRHLMTPGATFFLGKGVRHSFINDSAGDLLFSWTIMPGRGLPEFFAAIGRPRRPGEPAPASFARPDDVGAIEARTGFTPPK